MPAVWGQMVRITADGCASALSEYGNPDTIVSTLYTGATAAVYNSERFVHSGKYTYAYQLSNGSYVLAKDVELLDVNTPVPTLTGGEVSYDALTRCTAITYPGQGNQRRPDEACEKQRRLSALQLRTELGKQAQQHQGEGIGGVAGGKALELLRRHAGGHQRVPQVRARLPPGQKTGPLIHGHKPHPGPSPGDLDQIHHQDVGKNHQQEYRRRTWLTVN